MDRSFAPQPHTALHYAVFARMPDLTRLLMQLGANPYAGIYPSGDATNPLATAAERGNDEIASIIREEEKIPEAGRPVAAEVSLELRHVLRIALRLANESIYMNKTFRRTSLDS